MRNVINIRPSSTRQEQAKIETKDFRRPRPGVEAKHLGAQFPDRWPAWGSEAERITRASSDPARHIVRRWIELSPHPALSLEGHRSLGGPTAILPLAGVVGFRGAGVGCPG
jgi:hypothetical protein